MPTRSILFAANILIAFCADSALAEGKKPLFSKAEVENYILNSDMVFAEQQAFSCIAGNDLFPSKNDDTYDPMERYKPDAEVSHWSKYYTSADHCDAGDMVLFNGLLCASGDSRGCKGVGIAQSSDGRWWRAKTLIGQNDTKEQASFSTDQALGVYNYVAKTGDKDAFKRWIHWISQNPHVYSPLPSYCTHKECVFKAIDCPILITIAAAMHVSDDAIAICGPIQGDIPTPDKLIKQFNDAGNAFLAAGHSYLSQVDELAGKLGPLAGPALFGPGYFNLTNVDKQFSDIVSQYRSARELVVGAFAAHEAEHLTAVNAAVNSSVSIHLTGVNIFLLRNLGYTSVDLDNASLTLLSRDKDNPFFEYLAHGRTDRMRELLVKKCPNERRPSLRRFQWFPERDESTQGDTKKYAWQESMYWDCIFLINLYKQPIDIALNPGRNDGTGPLREAEKRLGQVIRFLNETTLRVAQEEKKIRKRIADTLPGPGNIPVVRDYCAHNWCPPSDPVGSYCDHNWCP